MSLSAVHGTLSSLKSCQADIGTGMDIVTDVAMDLAEAQGKHYSVMLLSHPHRLCWSLFNLSVLFFGSNFTLHKLIVRDIPRIPGYDLYFQW